MTKHISTNMECTRQRGGQWEEVPREERASERERETETGGDERVKTSDGEGRGGEREKSATAAKTARAPRTALPWGFGQRNNTQLM